jgi:hypothetical protein
METVEKLHQTSGNSELLLSLKILKIYHLSKVFFKATI